MGGHSARLSRPGCGALVPYSMGIGCVFEGSNLVFQLQLWRVRGINAIRVCFGLTWLVNAWFAWQPGFLTAMTAHAVATLPGQPTFIQSWIHLWVYILSINPAFFSGLIALLETTISLGLLAGTLTNAICLVGIVLSLFLWSTAEGFVLPYNVISPGAMLTYTLVFLGLIVGNAGYPFGLDRFLCMWLGRWYFLSSASSQVIHKPQTQFDLQDPYNQVLWLPPRGSAHMSTQVMPATRASRLSRDKTGHTDQALETYSSNTQSRLNAIRGQRLSPLHIDRREPRSHDTRAQTPGPIAH